MSKVHYFQRYSQKENVATNNTLLLLSRLYDHSPSYLESFLNDLVETGEIVVGPTFAQQIFHSGRSIPDAAIEQQSFKIIVETKDGTAGRIDQLTEHLNAFGDESTKVLVYLARRDEGAKFKDELRRAVREFNLREENSGREVVEICTTFEEIISSFDGSLADHDHEMHELLEDYKDYCFTEGLLPRVESWLRIVPCGQTLAHNREFALYYQPITRSSREHRYLGFYKDKMVQYIGRVSKVVAANVEGDTIESDTDLTHDEEDRIKGAIRKAEEIEGYDIATDHRFYLVEELYETQWRKSSPGGLQGQRYFDLVAELDLKGERELPDVRGICERLQQRTWR